MTMEHIEDTAAAALDYATKWARDRFENWAGMDAPDLPEDAIDAMQVRLARWQVRKFDRCDHLEQTLGVIEELGESYDADTVEEALDGLGDTLVYAGQLCITARLALGPILALAEAWHRDPGAVPGKWQPVSAAGYLAHVTGKRQQRTRGFADDAHYRRELVRALALVIVRAVDNVTVNQMISGGWDAVNPVAVYFVTGQHVIARSDADPTVTTAGVDGVESPVAEVIEERFLDGTEQEVSDAEIVTDIDELRARIIEVAADFGLRQATPEEVSEWLRPAVTGGVADQRAASASDTPTIEITAEEIEEALRAEPEAP
jgi:hypothetical protein